MQDGICVMQIMNKTYYENKKGRIISFTNSPQINKVRKALASEELLGEMFYAELNYYYDITENTYGFHGQKEKSYWSKIREHHYHYTINGLRKIVSLLYRCAIIQLNDGDVLYNE